MRRRANRLIKNGFRSTKGLFAESLEKPLETSPDSRPYDGIVLTNTQIGAAQDDEYLSAVHTKDKGIGLRKVCVNPSLPSIALQRHVHRFCEAEERGDYPGLPVIRL
jgi:hypothetical protein